jgi:hypothetical protein
MLPILGGKMCLVSLLLYGKVLYLNASKSNSGGTNCISSILNNSLGDIAEYRIMFNSVDLWLSEHQLINSTIIYYNLKVKK